MRKQVISALLMGALAAAPAIVFAAAPVKAQSASAKRAAAKPAATHATRGVVKSLDDSTLVITRTGKAPSEMTFVMNSSTHREGSVAVGSPVSVRYHEDGKSHVATAIRVEQPKPAAKATAKK